MNGELCRATGEWLAANVGSHEIYGIDLLEGLPKGLVYDSIVDRVRVQKSGLSGIRLHTRMAAVMRATEGAVETHNPKGAYLNDDVPPDERVFVGFELSRVLDVLLTGSDAGSGYFGRGTAHRARIAHLQAQREEPTP